ncbi:hypothetical protein Q7C36_007460 [Tachysurus vachellii]|uniref:Uncharacterized protein n=1 Tax=Tachysurus vachellii TaxID=175792 RepID=A0AA88N5H9_TACVA|nr:hypothetical protein Q7C36_007460 [Tachysurus vachellii]
MEKFQLTLISSNTEVPFQPWGILKQRLSFSFSRFKARRETKCASALVSQVSRNIFRVAATIDSANLAKYTASVTSYTTSYTVNLEEYTASVTSYTTSYFVNLEEYMASAFGPSLSMC